MLIQYDPEADALYIRLSTEQPRRGEVSRTDILDEQRRVDVGADGEVLGIEILWVSQGFALNGLPNERAIGEALHSLGALASVA